MRELLLALLVIVVFALVGRQLMSLLHLEQAERLVAIDDAIRKMAP